MTQSCNGWTNWETWNFMVTFGDDLESHLEAMVEYGKLDLGLVEVAEQVEEYIAMVEEQLTEGIEGFALDILSQGFSAIDEYDIAEGMIADIKEKIESGELEL